VRPEQKLRILIITKVFPNSLEPLAAAFNRQQFLALSRVADVELLAVVQWFPGAELLGPRTWAGRMARLPAYEWIDGLFVRHPRILHLPRVDYQAAPALYVASLWPWVRRFRGKTDVVLGSFAYPDGVAAVWLARLLGVPSAVYVLGSDLNVATSIPGVPALLSRALPEAARVIAVSRDLADKAVFFGARPESVAVVPNGVDRALFRPRDRVQARAALGMPDDEAPWLLFVGRLEPAKGVDDLLDAFGRIAGQAPEMKLALVGEGSLLGRCRQEAERWPGRVLVAGGRSLEEVSLWMAACNAVVLPSWNEGTPNVVLEALASGRRVVATRVGGIPDLVTDAPYGELVAARDVPALAAALQRAAAHEYDPQSVAAGSTVSWNQSAERLLEVLRAAAGRFPQAATEGARGGLVAHVQ
jgi:teichuronic acid biosynthesis glycosyltransferase TuaC